MGRSIHKGPYIEPKLMEKVQAAQSVKEKRQVIKTWSRRSIIIPEMVA